MTTWLLSQLDAMADHRGFLLLVLGFIALLLGFITGSVAYIAWWLWRVTRRRCDQKDLDGRRTP